MLTKYRRAHKYTSGQCPLIGRFGRRPRPGYALTLAVHGLPSPTLSTTAGGHLDDRAGPQGITETTSAHATDTTGSVRRGGQTRKDDVVYVRSRKTMGAGVVLEGCDHPVLGLDRREPGQARALHELQHCVVRRPRV